MRVLTWNLYHGRADPPAGRALLPEFTAALQGWDWDVALLQEVPPWWPSKLASACGAQQRTALTSRNDLLSLRRLLAERFPDAIKSNGGGSNAILVREQAITAHERRRLRWLPERRVVHAVQLADGTWWGNVHAQVHSERRALADAEAAAAALTGWAGKAPAILGGDFNVREPRAGALGVLGGHGVDHVLGMRWRASTPPQVLEHAPLSDHAPVLLALERAPRN